LTLRGIITPESKTPNQRGGPLNPGNFKVLRNPKFNKGPGAQIIPKVGKVNNRSHEERIPPFRNRSMNPKDKKENGHGGE